MIGTGTGKTLFQHGKWSVRDTSKMQGLYPYSLYFNDDWCSSYGTLARAIADVPKITTFQKFMSKTSKS